MAYPAPSQISSYSTLSGALTESTPFQSPYRRWLPQTAYVPVCKFRSTTGSAGGVHSAVSFDYIGAKGQGVSMRDARNMATLGQLKGSNDFVMAGVKSPKVTLRIMVSFITAYLTFSPASLTLLPFQWPGYLHVDWARNIEIHTPTGPITRAQLANIIATNFARFVEVRLFLPASAWWTSCSQTTVTDGSNYKSDRP